VVRIHRQAEQYPWRLAAARTAMPAPNPAGLRLVPYQRKDPTSHSLARVFDYAYRPGPGVAAFVPGREDPIGHIDWMTDYHIDGALGSGEIPPKPGEVGTVEVHPDYQRAGVATALFDHARSINPEVHHSENLSPAGRKWVDHEQSR
jgi:GNAT superfamily N-acetyltransferase